MSYVYGLRATAKTSPLTEALRQELYPVPYESINWNRARWARVESLGGWGGWVAMCLGLWVGWVLLYKSIHWNKARWIAAWSVLWVKYSRLPECTPCNVS